MPEISKRLGVFKSITYTIIVVLLFFASVESIQRVKYSIRFRSFYWLFYGFAHIPSDYESMHEGGLERRRLGIEVIEVRNICYDGYRKYNPNWKTSGYKINSFGFRGNEFDINKKEGIQRIVALGGSTTFGAGVEDGCTYPELLEKILNSKGKDEYEVINAGVSSVTAKEISNLLNKEIISLKPDIIIINSLFNDLYNSRSTYKSRRDFLRRINQILLQRSLFYCTLREKIAVTLNKAPGDLYKASLQDMLDNFMEDDSFWSDLKITFRDIVKPAKAKGMRVIIIKEPVWLRNYGKDDMRSMLFDERLRPVYQKAYALFDDIAKEEDAEVVDAASYFDRIPKKEEFFTDGLHLTEKGNRYLAELTAEKIFSNGAAHKSRDNGSSI